MQDPGQGSQAGTSASPSPDPAAQASGVQTQQNGASNKGSIVNPEGHAQEAQKPQSAQTQEPAAAELQRSDASSPEEPPPLTQVASEFDMKSAEVRISVAESNAEMHRKEKDAIFQQVAALNQKIHLAEQGQEPVSSLVAALDKASDPRIQAGTSRASTKRDARAAGSKVCL